MVKSIARIGNSHGLIFDSALRELTGLKAGDHCIRRGTGAIIGRAVQYPSAAVWPPAPCF
jgi:hypothetical protein